MAYTNYLLFNNAFIRTISPSAEEQGAAWAFLRTTARDYYRQADFSSPARMADTLIRPILQVQSLDLASTGLIQEGEYILGAPWDMDHPLGMMWITPHHANLDGLDDDGRVPKGQHWMVKAVEAAQRAGVRWAVLTNGDCWRLLDANSLRCYEAYLEIELKTLVQARKPSPDLNLAAYLFYTIFRLEDSLDADGKGLDALLERSLHAAERTEHYLKQAVCDSLDAPGGGDGIMAHLCMGLVQAVDPEQKRVFTEEERSSIYRDATYLLYRLLFIFYAEARGLLPVENENYRQVSLDSLVTEAVNLHDYPEQATTRPTRLWNGLKALFNFIDIGDVSLNIAQFDGGLFDDKERPYLSQYKIDNIYLAAALRELAYEIDQNTTSEPLRIDYRDLSVRHLGSLYEGMIEYRLFIAEEDLLARREKDGRVRFVKAAEAQGGGVGERIPAGHVYFAQSPHERKSTGTHYTAEDLVEKLVRQTVLRLLDERLAGFEPQLAGWLMELAEIASADKRAAMHRFIDQRVEEFVQQQVLSLRVCDPAMGSGHFLVHTAHQVTNFILRTLAKTPWDNPDVDLAAGAWRRRVVENCLYGVDINPMAVELAKLSLWLATMQTGRPLSFLDHHLKAGNSLLGASLEEIEALLQQDELSSPTARGRLAEKGGQYLLISQVRKIQEKMGKANTLLQKIASQIVSQAEDIHQQELDYEEVEKILAPYKHIGDLIVAQKMGLKIPSNIILSLAKAYEEGSPLNDAQTAWQANAQAMLTDTSPLHWGLEFPIAFWSELQKGFNVVVGNPPFLGGYKIRGELGVPFAEYLRRAYVNAKGQADLCVYVLRKAYSLLIPNGYLGMVATNTLGQGDTRLSGLAYILQNDGAIVYTDKYVKWSGDATVEVILTGIIKKQQDFHGIRLLDGISVPYISSWLDDLSEIEPKRLSQNNGKAFIGDALRGMGFILEPEEALYLLKNPKNNNCVLPYLIGEELNSEPEQKPSRFVICFKDWDLETARQYPELLQILEERVKPERDKVGEKGDRENWWKFARYRGELRKATANLQNILVRSCISDTNSIVFVPTSQINSKQMVIFAFDDYYHFSILQSMVHEVWLRRNASTMRTDVSYSISGCFSNFPFPQILTESQKANSIQLGQAYYRFRQGIMLQRQLGLTKTYNLFNNPSCHDEDVQQMRRLQIDMDKSVLVCYGWQDIDLQHDFYPNDRKKIRFMPSVAAQREIFTRLIALNQEIAAEEAARGKTAETEAEPEEEDEE